MIVPGEGREYFSVIPISSCSNHGFLHKGSTATAIPLVFAVAQVVLLLTPE